MKRMQCRVAEKYFVSVVLFPIAGQYDLAVFAIDQEGKIDWIDDVENLSFSSYERACKGYEETVRSLSEVARVLNVVESNQKAV